MAMCYLALSFKPVFLLFKIVRLVSMYIEMYFFKNVQPPHGLTQEIFNLCFYSSVSRQKYK